MRSQLRPTGGKGSGSEETCANWDEVLTADNHALSTAVANDYGHDEIAAEIDQKDDDANAAASAGCVVMD